MRSNKEAGLRRSGLLWLIMLVLLPSLVYAFACYCDGYVFNSDLSPTGTGVDVNVTNLNTLELEQTTTGSGFPPAAQYANRYKTSYECTAGVDYVEAFASNGTHSDQKLVLMPTSSQAYANLTLHLLTVDINSTPFYQFTQPNQSKNYTITVINTGTTTENYTLSATTSLAYSQFNQTTIQDLGAGSSAQATLTLNHTTGGYFTTIITAAIESDPDNNRSTIAITEVNHTPTVSNPADNPDPILPGNQIQITATVADAGGDKDTSKILVCTNNTPLVSADCSSGSNLCDYGDAPITASATGVTVMCYHNVTEANGTTVTYYVTAIDSHNASASFTTQQSFYVGAVSPPPTGGGGGGGAPPAPEPEPTCGDGIQNQGELGVDCGGPCPPCWTCSDGIRNQNEINVDCGGPCPPCETCHDGIQNQGELGVDCGGPCADCGTCDDGIQNPQEEGIDCGGPCPSCDNCWDGIQNQGETDIDCGGPCAPCSYCSDGEQNHGEEAVDCGGPCAPCAEPLLEEPLPEEPLGEQEADTNQFEPTTVIDCNEKIKMTEVTIDDLYKYSVYGLDENRYSIPIKIPKNYVLALPPFEVDCPEEKYKLNIAVPDNLEDLKVLRCRGDNCRVTNMTILTDPCQEETENITLRREFNTSSLYVEFIQTTLNGTNRTIESSAYNIGFKEEVSDLEITVTAPENITYPRNIHIAIVGQPIQVNISDEAPIATLRVPYSIGPGEDEESVALFAQRIEGNTTRWIFIGGETDTVSKIIQVDIDLNKYAQDGKVIIAPLTVKCTDCPTAGFRLEYTPKPDTRKGVVLLHGLFGTSKVWEPFIRTYKLTNQPYQLWTFSYLVSKPINESAVELASYLQANSFRFDTVDIVGYSLGGMVTQLALRYAYEEHEKDPTKFPFIEKVDKTILIATPNDGSPVSRFINQYLTEYINRNLAEVVPVNQKVNTILSKGIDVEEVPGIRYYVIAGTETYDYMKAGLSQTWFAGKINDGLVSLDSAQHIGRAVLDDDCVDFWSRPRDHTHLITDRNTQDLIAQILNIEMEEDIRKQTGVQPSLGGFSDYFAFQIEKCSPEDRYIVIGKLVEKKEREVLCACGDGVCSGFETSDNCPDDCTKAPTGIIVMMTAGGLIIIWFILPILRDYILGFINIIIKDYRKKKYHVKTKQKLLSKGFDVDTLYLYERVVELWENEIKEQRIEEDDMIKSSEKKIKFHIDDKLKEELPKEIRKLFSWHKVQRNWMKYKIQKLFDMHPIVTEKSIVKSKAIKTKTKESFSAIMGRLKTPELPSPGKKAEEKQIKKEVKRAEKELKKEVKAVKKEVQKEIKEAGMKPTEPGPSNDKTDDLLSELDNLDKILEGKTDNEEENSNNK